MEEVSVSPSIGLMCIIEDALVCQNWILAMMTALELITTGHPVRERFLMQRACRIFVEITFSLPVGHEMRQDHNLVQMLVFSKVEPDRWPGTLGIAAEMYQMKTCRIGNVVTGDNGIPLIVAGNDWCEACYAEQTHGYCQRCKEAHYCSPEHQKAHWPMHKFECLRMRNDDAWSNCTIYERGLNAAKAALDKLMELMKEK